MNSEKNLYFAYRSFWPEPETHRKFDDMGVKTVCFFAANTINSLGEPYCKYPPNWVGKAFYSEGQYDFEPVDTQMANLMHNSPSATFICIIDLNTPPWLSADILRCNSFNQLGRLCSDPEWRRITAKYMRNFIEHMQKHYPDKIDAYVLACGSTSEWYDLSNLVESPSRSAAWITELASLGRPPAEIPGLLARNHISFDGLLRDPAADGDALHYIKFCSDQIADTIKYFLRKAREILLPETELGVFYGYPLVLEGERVIIGNNDCREVLKSPDLDFIISTNGGFAAIGDGGGELGPTESVQLHGKRYLHECDQRTHCYNKILSEYITVPFDIWKTEEETLAGIKRELACMLIKQCSCWWFDMWGGFYTPPAVMELLARGLDIYNTHVRTPVESLAEIALIIDPDSIFYLNQNDNERIRWFYYDTKRTLDRVGAPYECYHFDDIPNIRNRERIKLWLIPALFEITPEKRQILNEYVRCNNQTLLTMYAPGISDGTSLDATRVKELTGTEFGTPGVNITEMEGHTSVYVGSGPGLTTVALKRIANNAGVHLYTEYEQPVHANSKFLSIHTAKGGTQRIRLPKKSAEVRELISNRVVATNCSEFDYAFQAPDTALFSW